MRGLIHPFIGIDRKNEHLTMQIVTHGGAQ